MKSNQQTKKFSDNENIHIILSKEHGKFQNNIKNCFGDLDIDVQANLMRCSINSLPMQIMIFLGSSFLSGLAWDLLKSGIKNIFKQFKDARVVIRDDNSIMYSVLPDGKINVVVTPDRYSEFGQIKNLDDLEIFFKKKQAVWKTKKLGEICDIYQPKTISAKEMVLNGKYVVFGANGIIGRYNKYNHEESQLLVTCRGATCGSVNISHPKSWITGNAMVVRPKNDSLDLKYLEYIFRGGLDITKVITGAAQPQITRANLEPVNISYPESISEQQRIVKILDGVFEKIEKTKENAEKNLQYAKELFKSYLQNIFANPNKDWKKQNIGEFLKLEYGKPLDKKDRCLNGKFPVYGANGEKDRTNKFYYNKSTVIIGRKGSAGELNLTENKFWPLDVTYFITFDDEKYDLKFVYFLLLTLKLTRLAKGVKPGINRNDVYSINVFMPSLKEQKSIVAKLNKLSLETKKLEAIYKQKLADLEELKKSILQQAFSGKL